MEVSRKKKFFLKLICTFVYAPLRWLLAFSYRKLFFDSSLAIVLNFYIHPLTCYFQILGGSYLRFIS